MAAICRYGNSFFRKKIPCHYNELARYSLYQGVKLEVAPWRSLYFTEILWTIFILDIGDVLPVLYLTFSNALIYQIHPFKLNQLLYLLWIGLYVCPHVAKFFYSWSHNNILATFSGYSNRIFRKKSPLKMSKMINLLMMSKLVNLIHKNIPNLSEGDFVLVMAMS